MTEDFHQRVHNALDHFEIEVPSWGFADTGTRFGKFLQDGAAIDLADKLSDVSQIHKLMGCCPKVALNVLWDFTEGDSPGKVVVLAEKHGVEIGSINANFFEDQEYRLGSLCNADPKIRERASRHVIDSIKLGQAVNSRVVSLWMADGINYPGHDSIGQWRVDRRLAPDPLLAFRDSRHLKKISAERKERRGNSGNLASVSYA